MEKIKQIVTHFTDNDLYTFTCMLYILMTYPRAEVIYSFFDRNNTRYPKGFDKILRKQIEGMSNVVITNDEINFMRSRCYFLPEWFFTFLKGYRFNPDEVNVFQDLSGNLSITIKGKWYSAIMWEMPILSTISELMHIINGDVDRYDKDIEWKKAYDKGVKAIGSGILLSDMGTRRRFSFDNQRNVLSALVKAQKDINDAKKKMGVSCVDDEGKLVGTSNVWFAKEFGITPIGTMSHQICSFEECVSGVFECNYNVMDKWSKVYDGSLGIFLPDCFGSKVFLNNLSKRMAMMFSGIRIDSGDEIEETEKMINKYKQLGIDPSTKQIVYSNALTIDKAIDIHKKLGGRMKDSYGIGTHLMADVDGCKYSNIVIKLTGMRITESREWHDCVKLSNDKGKTLGDRAKCEYLLRSIG